VSHLRHTLCFLEQQALPLSSHSSEELGVLEFWLKEQHPLIVPLQPENIHDDHIRLALPYFDKEQKKKMRFSYLFTKSAIKKHQELPFFHSVFPSIKTDYEIRVYGSYCWQYLTGQTYVHNASDLDLLVVYAHQSLTALTTLYHQLVQELKTVPLDGEVRFPNLGDCSWLELTQAEETPTILVKSNQALALVKREDLYAQFPALFS
jgi:phosphoribosyl-dephospho-CoA transferase